MPKCDYQDCTKDAIVRGFIFGHVTGSGEKDRLIPVNACNKHRKAEGFYEDSKFKD